MNLKKRAFVVNPLLTPTGDDNVVTAIPTIATTTTQYRYLRRTTATVTATEILSTERI